MIKELSYSWTQEDVKNYGEDCLSLKSDLKQIKNKFCLKTFIIKTLIVVFATAIFALIAFIFSLFGTKGSLAFLLAIFILSFLVSKIGNFVIPFPLSKKVQQIKQSLIINSDSNEVMTNTVDNKTVVAFNWEKIQKIYNTEKNILLFIASSNAFIIPKRIFNSEEEMNETWNLIQECFNKSR